MKPFFGLLVVLVATGLFAALIVFTITAMVVLSVCQNGRLIDHTIPQYCREEWKR